MGISRPLAILLLVLSVTTVPGCARLALMQSDDPLADMEQARKNGDFEYALYIAEHLDPEHEAWKAVQERLPEVKADIRAFELRHIRKAEALAANEAWQKAYGVLDNAMNEWRASEPLREARDRIRKKETLKRRQTLGDLYLAEARWRLASDPVAGQLTDFSDATSRRRHRQWERHNRRLAEHLAEQAEWFAEREDWHRVRDYLEAATSLDRDAGDDQLLARAREYLADASRQTRVVRERNHRKQARQLLEHYQATGELDDLLALRRFVDRNGDSQALQDMAERVKSISRERFQSDLERGDALYARGEYHQAWEVWKSIAPLQPDNAELSKKLERVERVLSKLRNLENR